MEPKCFRCNRKATKKGRRITGWGAYPWRNLCGWCARRIIRSCEDSYSCIAEVKKI